MRCIAGEAEPSAGAVVRSRGLKVGYVEQDIPEKLRKLSLRAGDMLVVHSIWRNLGDAAANLGGLVRFRGIDATPMLDPVMRLASPCLAEGSCSAMPTINPQI